MSFKKHLEAELKKLDDKGYPDYYKKSYKRLLTDQRALERKVLGSNSYKETEVRIARTKRKMNDNWKLLRKKSLLIVNNYIAAGGRLVSHEDS